MCWNTCVHIGLCVLAITMRVCMNEPLAQIAMARCSGTTRKGTRCTITSTSEMIDDSGRLVALPLRRGGELCAIHAKPFVVRPATPETSLITVYLDLETTGVDVAHHL